jgi:hypothetical protein
MRVDVGAATCRRGILRADVIERDGVRRDLRPDPDHRSGP